jgi:CHAD domain-containing protein
VGWVADALSAGFAVVGQPAHRERALWLDTFDWRLLRAGLVLRQSGRAPRAELALEHTSGEVLEQHPTRTSWPSMVDGLPASPLRTAVEGPLGVRALLALVEVDVRTANLALLDAEHKTVVRVAVRDARVNGAHHPPVALRVELTAVRGYERELSRAARLLRSVDGVSTAPGSLRHDALRAAGIVEKGYTGKLAIELDPAAPARRSVAQVLVQSADLIALNTPGTVADWDTEFLHDLRIAVRQTRSVRKFAGDVLPEHLGPRFDDEWRWLAALTTPTRDLDVMLLGLRGLVEGYDLDGLSDLEPLLAQLSARRRREFRALRTGLTSARFENLLADWRAALVAAADEPAAATRSTSAHAAARIARAHRRLLKRASAITTSSGVDDLHDLRKSGKELRYLLDVYRSLHDPAIHKRLVRDLKALQDCLGDIQDSNVHRQQLAEFVESHTGRPVPTTTLLSVGALIDRLQARQQRAQTELMSRLTAFTATATTARLAALTRSAG